MKIEHVAIWTQDLERLKNFYVNFFNGKANQKYHNPGKNFESYFITFDSGARLEIMQMPSVKATDRDPEQQYTGLIHIAFSVGSRQKVDELTALLQSSGYRVAGLPRLTGDGYYESVVFDPDFNRIEITE